MSRRSTRLLYTNTTYFTGFTEMDSPTVKVKRGSQCSVQGGKYEQKVHDVVSQCLLQDSDRNISFNTQLSSQLGGSTAVNDLQCNFNETNDIGIEIKKNGSPDYTHCKMFYDDNEPVQKWRAAYNAKSKVPEACKKIYDNLLQNTCLFNNEKTPFMERDLTLTEWNHIKKSTDKWNDVYVPVPSNTIQSLYKTKGCQYIQVEKHGLYHLGEDICGFGVPEFQVEQRIRIRIKVHHSKNAKGFCALSVMAAAQPVSLKKLVPSPYSLDNVQKLPPKLLFTV